MCFDGFDTGLLGFGFPVKLLNVLLQKEIFSNADRHFKKYLGQFAYISWNGFKWLSLKKKGEWQCLAPQAQVRKVVLR